jgi:hypothetical protein
MPVSSVRIDGQNVGLRLLGQTSVTLLSLNLTTGDVESEYLTASDCETLQNFALRLFEIVPRTARTAGALGLASRLVAVSPADGSTLTLSASVSLGIARYIATVGSSPAALIMSIPHSITGGIMPGLVTTNASSGGGGGGGTDSVELPFSGTVDVGEAVYRVPETGRVAIADPSDPEKMPAVGIVTEIKTGGRCVVQFAGPVTGIYSAEEAETTLFVGIDGRLSPSLLGIQRVQTMGYFISPNTLVLHVNPSVLVRS